MSDDLLAKKRAPWEVEGSTAAPIYPSSGLRLDPNDPFEATLIDMVTVNRAKRHDYTREGSSPWDNFDGVEQALGLPAGTATDVLIATKMHRKKALATREVGPQNEALEDTLLDHAVYAVIAYARHLYPTGKVTDR